MPPDERLTPGDLIRERYQGIRPAPGYPACPDHTEKPTLAQLLDLERTVGITLTESYAMLPAASVCGWYFWRPEARYFGVGRIGRDQVADYARRKGMGHRHRRALAVAGAGIPEGPPMTTLRELIADGGVHVVDGAMGTMLYQRGMFLNVCYDELVLRHPTSSRRCIASTSPPAPS